VPLTESSSDTGCREPEESGWEEEVGERCCVVLGLAGVVHCYLLCSPEYSIHNLCRIRMWADDVSVLGHYRLDSHMADHPHVFLLLLFR
jgi:hypothetical protein